jgi:predicted GNAT family acetyltransferase
MPTLTFRNTADKHRYEALSDGELAGYIEYNPMEGGLVFTHTEVLKAFENQGIGSFLAKEALGDARSRNLFVVPVCTFVAGYLRKHREFLDVVKPDTQKAFKL